MKKEELSEKLNGYEYRNDIEQELVDLAKENKLVIVYGYSDDLIELEGAIYDEIGAYGGGMFAIVVPNKEYSFYDEEEEAETIKKFKNYGAQELSDEADSKNTENLITALFGEDDIYSWTFETDIPHATFDVIEDGDKQCRGIVFSLEDLKH